jgi:signal peptidase
MNAQRAIRQTVIAAVWGAATLAAIIVAVLALATILGHRSFTVLSGSMEPAISTGDVVMTSQIRPSEAKVGQVVSFRDPSGSKRLITHRVRRIRNDGRSYLFTSRGDANNTVERWSVPARGHIGRVWLRIPKIGYVLAKTRTATGRILMVVVPAVLLALLELWQIWRPGRRSGAPAPAIAEAGGSPPGEARPRARRELSDDEWLEAWQPFAYSPRSEIRVPAV